MISLSFLRQQYAVIVLALILAGALLVGVVVTMSMHPAMLTSILHSIASFHLLPSVTSGHH